MLSLVLLVLLLAVSQLDTAAAQGVPKIGPQPGGKEFEAPATGRQRAMAAKAAWQQAKAAREAAAYAAEAEKAKADGEKTKEEL